MKRSELLWGILLIGGGALLLLQNAGLIGAASDLFWMLAFAAFGTTFIGAFAVDTAKWWALIPGFTLLGLALVIGIQRFFPGVADNLGGMVFLGAIGLSFWTIYAVRPHHWWAIIPGGVLITLALVAGIGSVLPDVATGSVFFLGLALTFGLLAVLPTPPRPQRWPLVPAGVMAVLALATFTATTELLNYLWPVVLIGVGLFLLYRTTQPRAEPPAEELPPSDRPRRDEPTLPQPH